MTNLEELEEFKRLVQVVKKLRDPNGGCPWDLKQTHQSLLRFLVEESYEFLHAVESKDDKAMEEEIGDVLLQVVLHSVVAEQRGAFNLESVSKVLADKLIRRHPHVFDNPEGREFSDEEIKKNWKDIKELEKKKEYEIGKDYLAFPALFSSSKIGAKTRELNFDWDDHSQVSYKVEEEWQELKEELMPTTINKEKVKEELGDFLFSAAQLARHLDIDPEEALREANKKFIRRFNQVEDLVKSKGLDMRSMTQSQLDEYWMETKAMEKKQ